MLGDRGAADGYVTGEFRDGERTVAEQFEDRPPSGIGEGRQRLLGKCSLTDLMRKRSGYFISIPAFLMAVNV